MQTQTVKFEALFAYTIGDGFKSNPYPKGSDNHREFQLELHDLHRAELTQIRSELKGVSCQ